MTKPLRGLTLKLTLHVVRATRRIAFLHSFTGLPSSPFSGRHLPCAAGVDHRHAPTAGQCRSSTASTKTRWRRERYVLTHARPTQTNTGNSNSNSPKTKRGRFPPGETPSLHALLLWG